MHLVRAERRQDTPFSTPESPHTTTNSPSSASPSTTNPSTETPHPASSKSVSDGQSAPTIPIIIGAIAGVLGLLFLFFLIRRARVRHKNPKYVPTPFLKNAWKKWEPKKSAHHRLPDTHEHLEPISNGRSDRSPRISQPPPAARGANSAANNSSTTAGGVDRNTSVRSVMTLPAYNQDPYQNEQVLGREGERGGIDTVVEFPETVDDEERLREEEMEALYQVRVARRRENEEREERRRLRREARERGDYVALRELQARARASSTTSNGRTVDELRAEHERIKNERQKAVSSVSYGDLGVARHDGTRLRANSIESEREGLLGDAASIAASSHYHRRDRSASSILSIDTNGDFPSPGLTRPRSNSRPDSPFSHVRRPSHGGSMSNEGRAGSSPEMVEHDDLPPNSPPGYENIPLDTTPSESRNEPPPDYTSPILARGEHRSIFETSNNSTSTSETRDSPTHIEQPTTEGQASNSSAAHLPSPSRPSLEERRSSSRGVGGVPQLPSLRLTSLPSIQVDPSSPTAGRIDEETTHTSR